MPIKPSDLLLYVIAFLIVLLMTIVHKPQTGEIVLSQKDIDTFNTRKTDLFLSPIETNNSSYLWGLKKIHKTASNPNGSRPNTNVTAKKHELCIGSDCYHIVGIYVKKGIPYVTLTGKRLKHGIDTYTLHNFVVGDIAIQQIDANNVVFYDTKSSQEWRFDLFDVNISKYKPKDHNATQY